MKINKEHVITANLSRESYETKDIALKCLKKKTAKEIGRCPMCFDEVSLTVKDFCDSLPEGHSFCGLYKYIKGQKYRIGWYGSQSSPFYLRGDSIKGGLKLSSKIDRYFKGSWTVVIDIDETSYSDPQEYLQNLEYIPTFTYMSYSDSESLRKFHMLYIFSRELKRTEFLSIAQELTESAQRCTLEEVKDKCGTLMSQYFNGTSKDKDNYFPGVIYDPEDIIDFTIENALTCISGKNDNPEEKVKSMVGPEFFEDLCCAFKRGSSWGVDSFIKKYYYKYPYFYQTPGTPGLADFYEKVEPGESFSLPWYPSKIKDHHKRRRTLHTRARLRIIIKPELHDGYEGSWETLITNLVIDVDRFIDISSDEVIGVPWICDVITKVMSEDLSSIKKNTSGILGSLCTGRYESGIRLKPGNRGKLQEARFLELDNLYDRSLSVRENLDQIKWAKKSFLYTYTKSRGITSKESRLFKDQEMMTHYESSLSINKNLANLKSLGYKVSYGKLYKLVNI